jgi:hypothetical protein
VISPWQPTNDDTTEAKQVSHDTILGDDGKRGGIPLSGPASFSTLPTLPCRVLASPDPYSRAFLIVWSRHVEEVEGIRPCTKHVSSFCMVELQSAGTTGARFRNYGFLQSARDLFLFIPVLET